MNTARYNLVKSAGSWYHIAGTYNKTTGEQRLYVNGQLVNTQIHPAGNTIVPQTYYPDMRIGYSPIASGYFNGVIDDVRLYNHPITDGEVRDLYDAFRADMDVYYAFDEGTGTVVRDSSGNGNHGRITGATWIAGKSGSGLSFDGVDDYVTIPRRNHDEISLCAWFYKNENDTTGSDGIISGFRGNEDIQLREGFEMRFSPYTPDVLEFVLVTQDGSGTRTMNTARYNLVKS
ncbi:MAG: LamG-like jellyroll fold domain-containing protein, partial [Candidatus Brocadia sp.]